MNKLNKTYKRIKCRCGRLCKVFFRVKFHFVCSCRDLLHGCGKQTWTSAIWVRSALSKLIPCKWFTISNALVAADLHKHASRRDTWGCVKNMKGHRGTRSWHVHGWNDERKNEYNNANNFGALTRKISRINLIETKALSMNFRPCFLLFLFCIIIIITSSLTESLWLLALHSSKVHLCLIWCVCCASLLWFCSPYLGVQRWMVTTLKPSRRCS